MHQLNERTTATAKQIPHTGHLSLSSLLPNGSLVWLLTTTGKDGGFHADFCSTLGASSRGRLRGLGVRDGLEGLLGSLLGLGLGRGVPVVDHLGGKHGVEEGAANEAVEDEWIVDLL